MVGPRSYKDRDVKKLYALTRNRCSNPDCRELLIVAGKTPGSYGQLGKIAHIKAAEETGPRYDEDMTDDQRRSFPNLLLVCSRCHDLIDDLELESDYSVVLLERWKSDHEDNSWVPAKHIDAWGHLVIQEGDEQIELPYFRTDDGLNFYTDEQWQRVERAFYIYAEVAELVSTLEAVREMNCTYIANGTIGMSNITQAVERAFVPSPKVLSLLPAATDAAIYESPTARIFSLMTGAELSLDQLLWLAVTPQSLLLATSIEKASDL